MTMGAVDKGAKYGRGFDCQPLIRSLCHAEIEYASSLGLIRW